MNNGGLEQHRIDDLVIQENGHRTDLVAEHIAARPAFHSDQGHCLDDVRRQSNVRQLLFKVVHAGIPTPRSYSSRRAPGARKIHADCGSGSRVFPVDKSDLRNHPKDDRRRWAKLAWTMFTLTGGDLGSILETFM